MAERRINLLPPKEKEGLRIEERRVLLMRAGFSVIAVLLIAVGLLAGTLGFFVILERGEGDLLQTQQDRMEALELRELGEEIRAVNTSLQRADVFSEQTLPWMEILGDIAQAIPPNVYLEHLSLNSAGEVSLTGFAPTRQDVVATERALSEIPNARDVVGPFRNLEPERDISFSFKFNFATAP